MAEPVGAGDVLHGDVKATMRVFQRHDPGVGRQEKTKAQQKRRCRNLYQPSSLRIGDTPKCCGHLEPWRIPKSTDQCVSRQAKTQQGHGCKHQPVHQPCHGTAKRLQRTHLECPPKALIPSATSATLCRKQKWTYCFLTIFRTVAADVENSSGGAGLSSQRDQSRVTRASVMLRPSEVRMQAVKRYSPQAVSRCPMPTPLAMVI